MTTSESELPQHSSNPLAHPFGSFTNLGLLSVIVRGSFREAGAKSGAHFQLSPRLQLDAVFIPNTI